MKRIHCGRFFIRAALWLIVDSQPRAGQAEKKYQRQCLWQELLPGTLTLPIARSRSGLMNNSSSKRLPIRHASNP